MIIPNGTIQYKRKPDTPGLDPATGHPLRPTTEWSQAEPCQWTATRLDRTARAGGEARTDDAYSVLVEDYHADEEEARLQDKHGRTIAERAIKAGYYLRAVGQTELIL